MSNDISRRLALPENPDLEHLKDEAKERLALLRATAPETQLTEAQFQLARDYGFPSWRALKEAVEGAGDGLSAYAGFYRHDPALITNSCFSVTAKDGHLFVELMTGTKIELIRQEDGRFASPGLSSLYGFEQKSTGHVEAMIIERNERHFRLMRTDAATARSIDLERAQAREKQRRPRTSIILAPDILDRYVGHYASSSFGLAMEISRENTTLYVRITGQPRLPLAAETEHDFFYTMAPVQIHFRTEAGKAVALCCTKPAVSRSSTASPPARPKRQAR